MGQTRLCRRRQISGDVRAVAEGPRRVLGRARQAHRLDQALHQGQERLVRSAQRLDQMVRGRRHQRRASIASTAICPSAPTRPRSSGKATIPRKSKHITYAELAEQVGRFANVLEGARRQEGRPRHHLSADDPRGGLRDARLRAHRRDPFDRVRRLLARRAGRPHRGRDNRRSSSPPTRACAAAARCR